MKRVYINEAACMACRLCEVYCRLEHSRSKDLIKAFTREAHRPALLSVEKKGPISFAVTCRHCPEPYCVYACLTGALQRASDTGIVTVDSEKCIGCWTCILACPFGAIKQVPQQGKIAKCDLCAGREIPACVANCPNEALIYIESEESMPVQAGQR